MLDCPYCDQPVIEGADECDSCGHPLNDTHLPSPQSEVELGLLTDRLAIGQNRWPLVISPTMPVRECLRLLVDNRIGCLLVVEKGELIGIFTERDVLQKLNDRAVELADRPVSEFMTRNPQSLPATAKIAFAVQRMDQGGFRHVPITGSDGRPVGVFSVRDILGYLTRKMAEA
jgi:predicted transcriptional regulator